MHHLKWSFSLLIIRFLIETLVFEPIGRRLGVNEKFYIPLEPNKHLEKYFYTGKKNAKSPTGHEIEKLSSETGWATLRVKSWFFLKRKHTTLSDMRKFCGACWRFMCYTIIFVVGKPANFISKTLRVCLPQKQRFKRSKLFDFYIGIKSVLPKPWIADPMPHAIQWPLNQPIESDVVFYFFLQFTFYANLLWSLWFDIPTDAPDFYPMLLHHLVVLGLDSTGFLMNAHRVAAAVHLLHDPADVIVEFARLLHYVKRSALAQRLSRWSFLAFAVTWVITRNIVYPIWVLIRVVIIVPQYTGFCWAMTLTNGMMLIVYSLQIYWSYFIWRVVVRSWRQGSKKNVEEMTDEVVEEVFEHENDDDDDFNGEKKKKKSMSAATTNGIAIQNHDSDIKVGGEKDD